MIKLHLGCGHRDFGKDWIHIDAGDYSHLDYSSIQDLRQFEDNTVDIIYASHVIEYFDRDEIILETGQAGEFVSTMITRRLIFHT